MTGLLLHYPSGTHHQHPPMSPPIHPIPQENANLAQWEEIMLSHCWSAKSTLTGMDGFHVCAFMRLLVRRSACVKTFWRLQFVPWKNVSRNKTIKYTENQYWTKCFGGFVSLISLSHFNIIVPWSCWGASDHIWAAAECCALIGREATPPFSQPVCFCYSKWWLDARTV